MRPISLEEVERLAETADGEDAMVQLSAIVAISRTPGVTENAAERLLHLPRETVAELATDLAAGTAVESVGSVPMSDLRGPTLHEAAEALLSDRLRLVGLELLQLDIVAVQPA